MNKKPRLNLLYLLLLAFPLAFYFFYKAEHTLSPNSESFQFYSSLQSNGVKSVVFYKNDSPLVSWNGPFNSYTQLDYFESKRKTDEKGFRLKIEHVGKHDTLHFLSLNFLIDETVYSLQPEQFNSLVLSANCKLLNNNNQLILVSKDSGDIWIDLKSPLTWKSDSISTFKKIVLAVITLLFFLVSFYFKPNRKEFMNAYLISFFLLFFLWYLGKEASGQIRISDFSPNKSCTFFFNDIPMFKQNLSVSYNDTIGIRKTQAYPNQYQFYRINLEDSVRSINNMEVNYQLGFFKKTWPLNQVKPYMLNGNGLVFDNSGFSNTKQDPYLCLTSAEFTKPIKQLDFLRNSLYLMFCLISYAILLFLSTVISSEPKNAISYAFLLICFFTPAFYLFNAERLIMSEEKRLAFPLPRYSNDNKLKDYTKQLEYYMKDQLPGRGQLIIANNYSKYKVFSELATNPMVYFGKENWMFYIGENVKMVYENKTLYTEAELQKMTRTLEERRDWLKSQGIAYYLLFPRLSHYFYQEKVGEGIYQYNKKPKLEQFTEYLNKHSNINVIDVYSPMLKAKQTYTRDLYYRSDSHWNLFGSYFAYEAIIKRIQKDFPQIKSAIPLKEIQWIEEESTEADLSKLISLSGVITRHEFLPVHPDVNSSESIPAPHYPEYHSVHSLIVYQGKDTTMPNIVMNRDSYSNYLIPYFSKHFNRQTYIWSSLFFPTIIAKEKPDIVITEMMERFLDDLLIDNPPMPVK